MIRAAHLAIGSAAIAALSMPVSAFVNTMYNCATDPSSYGSLVASLNILSAGYDFQSESWWAGQNKHDSGFKAEILNGSGNPVSLDPFTNPNRTSLTTQVYSVTTPTIIPDGSGNLSLQAGDLVFAYRLRLCGNNANTIETLQEFGVQGYGTDIGFGYFSSSVLLGRGYSIAGLAHGALYSPVADPADFEEGDFGGPGLEYSSLEFNWPFGDQAHQLANKRGGAPIAAEEITLLMFARGVTFGEGYAKFSGVSGQAGPGTATVANDAPVLIPIVPAPGALALAGLGGLFSIRRRR